MAKKRILVTGGTGRVGAYAVGMLLERQERPVVYDPALKERLLSAVGVDPGKVTLVRGEMMDLPPIISAFRDYECDRIIHLDPLSGDDIVAARAQSISPLRYRVDQGNPMPHPETRVASDFSRAKGSA